MKESMKDEGGRMKRQHPRFARHSGALPPTSYFILHTSAFSLVEVVIAVGIFSFVIVAVMGTMGVALNSTRDSEMKLSATHTAATIIGTLKANPTNRTETNIFPNTLVGSGKDLYVDRQGLKTEKASAAFRLAWNISTNISANLYFCNIELTWPPGAPTNSVSSHRVATSILLP